MLSTVIPGKRDAGLCHSGGCNAKSQQPPEVPLRILNKGPEYLRSRILHRDNGFNNMRRRSAVELLEATKADYVKTDAVRTTRQPPANHCKRSPSDSALWEVCGPSALRLTTSTCGPGTERPRPATVRQRLSSRDGSEWTDAVDGPVCKPHQSHINTVTNRLGPSTPLCGLSVTELGPLAETHLNDCLTRARPAPLIGSNGPGYAHGDKSQPEPSWPNTDHTSDLHVATVFRSSSSGSSGYVEFLQRRPETLQKDFSLYNGHLNEEMECKGNTGKSKDSITTKDIPTISTEEWCDTHAETSSEADKHTTHTPHKMEEGSNSAEVPRRHRKSISRSRSDLTKRFSNSSDLSELSARFSRNSEDLEKFFNEMGLDRSVLEPMLTATSAHAQSSSSLHVFESVSSIGSADTRSWCSEESQKSDKGLKSVALEERTHAGPTNVVERNARIIKWLCNMKKVPSNPALPHSPHSTD